MLGVDARLDVPCGQRASLRYAIHMLIQVRLEGLAGAILLVNCASADFGGAASADATSETATSEVSTVDASDSDAASAAEVASDVRVDALSSCYVCVQTSCKTENENCQADSTCKSGFMCVAGCGGSDSCISKCISAYPSDKLTALVTCTRTHCADKCATGH